MQKGYSRKGRRKNPGKKEGGEARTEEDYEETEDPGPGKCSVASYSGKSLLKSYPDTVI